LNQYETMFLFDAAFAADFQQAIGEVERILQRSNAQVVFLEKWDERRLAYEIKGCKRGCYVLAYYKCDPESIAQIERDCALSDSILRVLVKQAEGVTKEQMEGYLPARQEEASYRSEGGSSRRDGDDGPAGAKRPEAKETEDSKGSSSGKAESKSAASESPVAVQTEESED